MLIRPFLDGPCRPSHSCTPFWGWSSSSCARRLWLSRSIRCTTGSGRYAGHMYIYIVYMCVYIYVYIMCLCVCRGVRAHADRRKRQILGMRMDVQNGCGGLLLRNVCRSLIRERSTRLDLVRQVASREGRAPRPRLHDGPEHYEQ